MGQSAPASWRRVPIVELCAAHVDCVNRTAPVVSSPTPFKMIRTTNVRGGFIDIENVKYVTAETYKRWTRRLVPKPGDVVLTREAPLGDAGMVRTDDTIFLGQRLYHFRPDPDRLDPHFLLYSLMAPDMQGQMRAFGSGSTVEHVRLADVLTLEIEVPSIRTQRRIGEALASYDDLIENNRRRILILEETARRIYREWFVDARFPSPVSVGGEQGDTRDWPVRPLGELTQLFRGRSYRSVDLADDGGLPFLNLKCIDREGGFRRSGLKRYTGEFRESHIARKGDILVAVTDMTQERRVVARAARVPTLDREFGVFSMDLVRVDPIPPVSRTFLYCLLRYSDFADNVKQHANGANVLHLSPDRVRDYPVRVPPADLVKRFSRLVEPCLETMDTLENQVANLRRTRDLLLPRLMSGQIRLDEAAA